MFTVENCVRLYTDATGTMMNNNVDFCSKITVSVNELITYIHCMIHREIFRAKNISPKLDAMPCNTIKIINFIKSYTLNSHLFLNLCKDMHTNYENLLLHVEASWLSNAEV